MYFPCLGHIFAPWPQCQQLPGVSSAQCSWTAGLWDWKARLSMSELQISSFRPHRVGHCRPKFSFFKNRSRDLGPHILESLEALYKPKYNLHSHTLSCYGYRFMLTRQRISPGTWPMRAKCLALRRTGARLGLFYGSGVLGFYKGL